MARKWILLAALLVAPMAPAAHADEADDAGPVAVPAERPAEADVAPTSGAGAAPEGAGRYLMDLSLAEAMELAIENNLGVQVRRHDPLIAWERNRAAWGGYDPEAFVEISRSKVETPIASALQATSSIEDQYWRNLGGLRGIVPVTSTSYEISFGGTRTRTDRSISSLREQWDSELNFSISQPLLRNLYWNQPWTEVKLSREAYAQSLADFRLALMDVVLGVESAYWRTVATEEQTQVAVKSLEAARKLLEQTEVQYEVGVVSRVEVVEAEAGVAEREVELIRARNEYDNAEDQLIDRVLGVQLTPSSDLRVNPTERPEDYTAYQVDVEEAAAKALERRPELASLDQAIRQQEIQLTFNRNQMAPQVDLVASLGYKGLAGKPCTPTPAPPGGFAFCSTPPTGIESDFGSSLDDYFTSQGNVNWSVGGIFSIPLGNHAPRARKRQAQIQLRRIRTQRTQLVQQIIVDIRTAARTLRSAQEGIEAAERRRLAAAEQFRAEGIRLEQGESTPFDVLQRERDLVAAQSQKIGALQLYRDAVAALERQQGTILERHNIVVDQARRLR